MQEVSILVKLLPRPGFSLLMPHSTAYGRTRAGNAESGSSCQNGLPARRRLATSMIFRRARAHWAFRYSMTHHDMLYLGLLPATAAFSRFLQALFLCQPPSKCSPVAGRHWPAFLGGALHATNDRLLMRIYLFITARHDVVTGLLVL